MESESHSNKRANRRGTGNTGGLKSRQVMVAMPLNLNPMNNIVLWVREWGENWNLPRLLAQAPEIRGKRTHDWSVDGSRV